MAKFELKLPKMGESVAEATLTSWLKEVGDTIEEDEAVLEIATDKVDSEVPSEVSGVLVEKLFDVDDVIQVGQTIAVIEIEGENTVQETSTVAKETVSSPSPEVVAKVDEFETMEAFAKHVDELTLEKVRQNYKEEEEEEEGKKLKGSNVEGTKVFALEVDKNLNSSKSERDFDRLLK